MYSNSSYKVGEIRLGEKLSNDLKHDATHSKFFMSYLNDRSKTENKENRDSRYEKITRRASLEVLKDADEGSHINM